jgi:hypothetical protein
LTALIAWGDNNNYRRGMRAVLSKKPGIKEGCSSRENDSHRKKSYLVRANELFKNPSGYWAKARALTT